MKLNMRLFAGELANALFRGRGRVCVLVFYMDDSADKKQERLFVVAGFLGMADVWFEAERHWDKRLRREGLEYFRTNECHTLTGEFAKLTAQHGEVKGREIRNGVLEDLWSIVKATELLGFCFLGTMPAYKEVQREDYGQYVFERDPYVQAHQHLIYHVAAHVCDNAHEPVAFVFDEHNRAAALLNRWDELKASSPRARPCMGTLAPLDDRQSPAVQMGDLLANTAKRAFENHLDNLADGIADLRRICGPNLAWVASWDAEYLRELRDTSIDVATQPDATKNPTEFRFPSGARIFVGHMNEKYQGQNIQQRGIIYLTNHIVSDTI